MIVYIAVYLFAIIQNHNQRSFYCFHALSLYFLASVVWVVPSNLSTPTLNGSHRIKEYQVTSVIWHCTISRIVAMDYAVKNGTCMFFNITICKYYSLLLTN